MLNASPSVFVSNTALDDLSHSYGFRSCPYRRDRRCLRFCHIKHCRPTGQFSVCPCISPTISASAYFGQSTSAVGLQSQSPHRESSLHQHSRPPPHQKTLVAFPRNHAKLLSTRFTRFNRRRVQLTRHPLRYHVKKARNNVSNVYCAFESEP